MKAISEMTRKTEKDMKPFLMDQCIEAIFPRGSKKERESLSGLMEKFMTGSGKTAKKMGVVCGKAMTANPI